MNKEQDIDNQLYNYLSPDLYCYVHNYIVDLKRQIDQLTNNWNELEEYIKDLPNNEYVGYLKSDIIGKMKEIKEKNDSLQ